MLVPASSGGTAVEFYARHADWWPLFSPPEDYVADAACFRSLLDAACSPTTVLELGSGGGHTASHLRDVWRLTLVDAAPGMLAVSRALNPDCEHVLGDMRSLRLGRRFDAVLLHDAVMYMTTEEELAAAFRTAWEHLRPGGALLVVPDCVRETFQPGTDSGGCDRDGRGLRYLEWSWDPDPTDTSFLVDYAFLLRDRDGTVRGHHERHAEGLFARADWLRLLDAVGFRAESLDAPLEGNVPAFLGRR